MKRLSKQKRDQLILVAVLTLMVVATLWFVLIRAQKENLQSLHDEKTQQENKAVQMHDKIIDNKIIETQLAAVEGKLADQEQDMAAGDLYASMVNTIRKFKLRYRLDIPQFSPASSVTDVDLLPKFPYKQVRIAIAGTGYYEDIGKFIADFENQYSASRILNLELVPSTVPGTDPEKLYFKMEIVSLVASGSTVSANPR